MATDKIKLRVFHRTKLDISLLWSLDSLSVDQKDNVKVLCEGKELQVTITTASDKDGVAKNTMICLVDHELNGLKHDAKYNLQVILGGEKGEPIVRKLAVLEYGVLPPFDRDKKSARVHLMAWDYVASTWVKVPAIRNEKYGYAIPVVTVPSTENKKK